MIMYEYVWLFMTTYDYEWLFMTMYEYAWLLSQPQLNLNSTQKLGVTWKWLYTITTTTHHKLNVQNILAVPDPILTKL